MLQILIKLIQKGSQWAPSVYRTVVLSPSAITASSTILKQSTSVTRIATYFKQISGKSFSREEVTSWIQANPYEAMSILALLPDASKAAYDAFTAMKDALFDENDTSNGQFVDILTPAGTAVISRIGHPLGIQATVVVKPSLSTNSDLTQLPCTTEELEIIITDHVFEPEVDAVIEIIKDVTAAQTACQTFRPCDYVAHELAKLPVFSDCSAIDTVRKTFGLSNKDAAAFIGAMNHLVRQSN